METLSDWSVRFVNLNKLKQKLYQKKKQKQIKTVYTVSNPTFCLAMFWLNSKHPMTASRARKHNLFEMRWMKEP